MSPETWQVCWVCGSHTGRQALEGCLREGGCATTGDRRAAAADQVQPAPPPLPRPPPPGLSRVQAGGHVPAPLPVRSQQCWAPPPGKSPAVSLAGRCSEAVGRPGVSTDHTGLCAAGL